MSASGPIWITEAEIVEAMSLPEAIDALEWGLGLQASGGAKNMSKTHATWGDGDTLHAIGAVYEAAGFIGTKTWAHTHGGATPLLIMWDAKTGALAAIIEAFALGQMRTGGISGVATRWMSREKADVFALIGTGKQALSQLASVAAVRNLRLVRIFGRDVDRLEKFYAGVKAQGYKFAIELSDTIEAAVNGADIVTVVTRAKTPILFASALEQGAHVNAIGAITPEREELSEGVLERATLVAADDKVAARKLSKEFRDYYGDDDKAWERVVPLCDLVARKSARDGGDLSVFKAMGMGVSDMALGVEIYKRVVSAGGGRAIDPPKKAAPRLRNMS